MNQTATKANYPFGTETGQLEALRLRQNLACAQQRVFWLRPCPSMDPRTFRSRVADYLQAKRQCRRLLKRHPELRKHAGDAVQQLRDARPEAVELVETTVDSVRHRFGPEADRHGR